MTPHAWSADPARIAEGHADDVWDHLGKCTRTRNKEKKKAEGTRRPMADGFGLIVRFTLRAGAGQEFDQLVAETLQPIREREPGTLVYACHRVDGCPDDRVFYELYHDRAAFDAHEQQPHVRRFLAERERYVDRVTVDFLSLTASTGITDQTSP